MLNLRQPGTAYHTLSAELVTILCHSADLQLVEVSMQQHLNKC